MKIGDLVKFTNGKQTSTGILTYLDKKQAQLVIPAIGPGKVTAEFFDPTGADRVVVGLTPITVPVEALAVPTTTK
jgi:hypothetical protein